MSILHTQNHFVLSKVSQTTETLSVLFIYIWSTYSQLPNNRVSKQEEFCKKKY